MICPNCGTQNAAGEKTCMGCRQQLPQIQIDISKSSKDNNKKEAKVEKKEEKQAVVKEKKQNVFLKNKKLIKYAIIAAIVILALVAAIVVIRYKTKNLNANDPIVRVEKVVNEYSTDIEKYVDYILPESLASYSKTVTDKLDGAKENPKLLSDISKGFFDLYETLKDTYGDDLSVNFDIIAKESMEEDYLDEVESFYAGAFSKYIYSDSKSFDAFKNDIAEKYEISSGNAEKVVSALNSANEFCRNIQVEAAYDLIVRVSFGGRQNKADALLDVYVIKVEGTWSIDIYSTYKKLIESRIFEEIIK